MTEQVDSYSITQYDCLFDAVAGEVRNKPKSTKLKYMWFFEGQNQQNKNWDYCKEWNNKGRYSSNKTSVKKQIKDEEKIMINTFKSLRKLTKDFILGEFEPSFEDYRIMKMKYAFSYEDVLIYVKNRKDMKEVRDYMIDYKIEDGVVFAKSCDPRKSKCEKTDLYKRMVSELNLKLGIKTVTKVAKNYK